MRLCTKCHLCYHAGNQMFPSGQFNSSIYFVLPYPSEQDMRRPSLDEFCSNEARLFFSYLKSFDIADSRFFYMVRCTPFDTEYPNDYQTLVNESGTKFCNKSTRTLTVDELSACSPYLMADLMKVQPSIIVSMGCEATSYLLRRNITKSDFSSYIGKIYEITIGNKITRLVPIYTMKECYEEYITQDKTSIQRKTIDVLHQVVSMRDGKWIDADKNNKLTYAMSYKEFKDYYDLNLKNEPELAYDIETNAALVYSKEFDIIGFSLAKRHEGVYVCLQSLDHKMSDEDIQACKDLLVYALKNTDKVVVHNSLYEMPATRYNLDHDIPADKIDDTMVMAKLMLGGTSGAGLKPTAQAIGYPDWETDLSLYIENFNYAMKRFSMATYRPVIQYIRDNPDKSFKDYLAMLHSNYDDLDSRIAIAKKTIEDTGSNLRQYKSLCADKEKLGNFLERIKDVASISDSYESLIRKYYSSDEEVNKLLSMICQKILHGIVYGTPGNVIPYHWIPHRLLTKYGATDSVATLDIKYDFLRQFKEQSTKEVDLYKGYRFMLKEYYAGYCLMMASMHWDDARATADKDVYANIMLRTLKFLFKHKVVQKYVAKEKFNVFLGEVLYENYNDILWETQHHRIGIDSNGNYVHEYLDGNRIRRNAYAHIAEIELTPAIRRDCEKRIINKLLQKVESSNDLNELRSLFNPASTLPSMASVASEALLTPKTRFCVLLKQVSVVKSSDTFDIAFATPEEKEFWDDLDDYKITDLKTNRIEKEHKFDALMKKYYLALLPDKSKGLTGREFYNTHVIHFNNEGLQHAVQTARDFKIDKFDDLTQIAVFEAYLESPMDQDDFSTWDFTFKWLFNFRSFKKAAKMVTSYIDGSVGRNNVWKVDKTDFSQGKDVVIRDQEYYETNPDEIINSSENDYLYQTNFRVCSAQSFRWQCLVGETMLDLADGSKESLESLFASNKREFVVKSYDVHNKCFVPSLCTSGVKVTGRSVPTIKITLDNGEVIQCTPEHKLMLIDGTYKEAKDLVETDELMSIII